MWHAQVRGTQDVELEFSDIKLAGQVCCRLLVPRHLCDLHSKWTPGVCSVQGVLSLMSTPQSQDSNITNFDMIIIAVWCEMTFQ